jgi:SagB-type dehydrogenase family enzyme
MAQPPETMGNRDTRATWHYHNGTKHPYGFLFDPAYRWSPAERPLPFKVYPRLEPIPLPLDRSPLGVPALAAISGDGYWRTAGRGGQAPVPDVGTLARILYFSAGVTKHIAFPGGAMAFRAAACTGALYHVELYLVCGDLPGLGAGVYHFDAQAMALRRLRGGDYRRAVVAASGNEPALAHAPAVLVATDVVWRNACKYREREYRHAFWDSGTLLANTLAVAAAHGLPAKVVLGFVDAAVGRLLDLDPRRELPLELVALGSASDGTAPAAAPPIGPLGLETLPVPDYQARFPAIRAMHDASSLGDAGEAAAWRGGMPRRALPPPSGEAVPLQCLPDTQWPPDPLESVIVRRGSTRRFAPRAITFPQLSTVLDLALRGFPADFLEAAAWLATTALNDVYLIVNAVQGLVPGAYVLRREAGALECLRPGDFRETARHLALDQDLAGDASVDVYFLADLPPVLERFGNRGYRAAQLEAAIAAGRMYLAAYAQGFGATGLTFYDDAVTDFFAPHARGKSVMFLIGVGKRAPRPRR